MSPCLWSPRSPIPQPATDPVLEDTAVILCYPNDSMMIEYAFFKITCEVKVANDWLELVPWLLITFIEISQPSVEATEFRVYKTHHLIVKRYEYVDHCWKQPVMRKSGAAEEERKWNFLELLRNDIACKLNIFRCAGSCRLLISVSICTEERGISHYGSWYRSLDEL